MTLDQGNIGSLAPLAPGQVDDFDAGAGKPVQRVLQVFVLSAAASAPAELEDVGGVRSVHARWQGRPKPLPFCDLVAAHLLGQVRNHMEEDVVIEHRRETGVGAAGDSDVAIFKIIVDAAVAPSLANRERGHVHQVEVVLEWRVMDSWHKKRELSVLVWRSPEYRHGFSLEDGQHIAAALAALHGLGQAPEGATYIVVGEALEL